MYPLDEQLKELTDLIKKKLGNMDGSVEDAEALEKLMLAQKTVLESMLMMNHINKSNQCGGGGCCGEH